MCVGSHSSKKRTSDLLEQELQRFESHTVWMSAIDGSSEILDFLYCFVIMSWVKKS